MTPTPEAKATDGLRPLIQEMLDNLKQCSLDSGCCHCGDSMANHADPMSCGHSPVDIGWTAAETWIAKASNALQEDEGWRCFHCGEYFTDKRCARDHFGRDEMSEAACVIKAGAEGSLVRALRRAEEAADDAIQAMHAESTDAAKAYHAQRCRHNTALIAAEEAGYERGLADGRVLPAAPQGQSDHTGEDAW